MRQVTQFIRHQFKPARGINYFYSLPYDLQKFASPERIKDTCCNFRYFVTMEESEMKTEYTYITRMNSIVDQGTCEY